MVFIDPTLYDPDPYLPSGIYPAPLNLPPSPIKRRQDQISQPEEEHKYPKKLEETAQDTIAFLKQTLAGVVYAVTGSYARKRLENEDDFNGSSDLDVVVKESELENAVRRFKEKKLTKVQQVQLYSHTLFSKSAKKKLEEGSIDIEIESRERVVGTHYREARTFREYRITIQNLMPIHLIGSLKNEQRRNFRNLNGINYLEPVSLTNLL